jgi:phosphoribosylglycinamide formyltransferase-1
MARRRVGVLISGGGSNLQALLDATAAPASPASIVLVVSNVAGAFGLSRAEKAGVPAHCLDHRRFLDRATFDAALDRLLRESGVDLVCLAGFMRILSADFVERWRDRLLNIHPSLLPAFPGLHTHARALASGVRIHGCTVHLVRPALDDGPILVQGVVPVLDGDDAAALAARVLEVEHRCYPLALRGFASGGLAVEGERVRGRECRLILHSSLAGG